MIEPAQLFKCMADETRLYATLLLLVEGELCVCELMHALQDSQPKISRHLAQLRSCRVLDAYRRGQWVYYAVAQDLPSWALDILHIASIAGAARLKGLQKNLKTMKNRPQCC